MASVHDNQMLFAHLFADKSLTPQKIYDAMEDVPFEFFVKYVFERAGYAVEHTGYQHGPGLDLKVSLGLHNGRRLHAGVQVKHFQPGGAKVTAPQVVSLRGGLPQLDGVVGYFVTTSTFNEPALMEASHGRRIWPIDGDHLVRYITYIRGTRAELANDTESDPRLRRNLLEPIPPEVFLAADEISFRSLSRTRVLTLANHKGGVGKTTSALNIALGLAARDKQVLLVDLDPQANLTRDLPSQASGATPTDIGDYFTGRLRLPNLIRQTQFPRVWLIPSHSKLIHSDEGIAAGPAAELRFARDLHATDVMPPAALDARPFDWIVIDTGPSMGLFTRAAFAASHDVLMPVAPEVFAEIGPHILKGTISAVQALVDRPIRVLPLLITKWQENTHNKSLLEAFTTELIPKGWTFLKAKIPLDATNITKAHLESGQGQRKTLFSHHAASKAAQGYRQALEEIL